MKIAKMLSFLFLVMSPVLMLRNIVACPMDEASQKRAQQIWEQAMIAKGGREQILNIKTLLIFDKKLDEVSLRVFPDKRWSWSRQGKPIGLFVSSFDFSTGTGYRVQNDNVSGFYKSPTIKMEWELADLFPLLLETKWVKPRILGSDTTVIDGRKYNVVCSELVQDKVRPYDFIFDTETNLLSRTIVHLEITNALVITDYTNYVEVNGIKFPQRTIIKLPDGKLSVDQKYTVKVDVDYRKDLFDKPPSIKDGPDGWKPKK